MMTIKRLFLTLTLAAATALPLYAYNETINHRQMTIVATEKSALYTDGSIMSALGLNPAQSQLFIYNGRLGNVPMGTDLFTLSAFVAEGAIEEDAGWRARHHFYDPVHNRSIAPAIAWRSWEWMLEERPIEDQDRSLRDARDFLTVAMTFNQGTPAEAHAERTLALTRMLLSLGHVMHHLQDMAQPQHVRHDQHVETWWTAALGASNPSRFEYYTAEHPGVVSEQSERAVPIFPGSSDFKSARDFWFNTAGTGVAQWVNRDFVSQGTNFITTDATVTAGRFAQPKPGTSTDYTIAELYAQSGMAVPVRIQNLCGTPPDICRMRMYSTAVSQRASTLSIFDQDMRAGVLIADEDGFSYTISRLFDLNRFNFDDAHQELITRAVSYSAGFLNHFFRGKLQITPPMRGPYAVVDHSTNEGFSTIQATVRNMTEGEALPDGLLRVIARFRRNGCYTPELTGEFELENGKLTPPCPEYRSPEIHARVSHATSVALGLGGAMELTFTFPDPIPLDATDLVLHAYYTGQVGEETESFALGVADVSEPTFIAFMNATDVFGLQGVFHYGQDIMDNIAVDPYSAADADHNGIYETPPDLDVRGQDLFFEISLDGAKVGDTATVPQGRFARIAALVDPAAGTQLQLWVVGRMMISAQLQARLFQLYPDVGWRITAAEPLRNHTMQFNSATFFRYDSTIPNIDSMPRSKVVDAEVLVPVYMAGNYVPGAAPASQWTKSMEVFHGMSANALAPMLPRQRSHFAAVPVKPKMLTTPPGESAAPAAVRAIRPHPKALPIFE
jgi:hypothetical protein